MQATLRNNRVYKNWIEILWVEKWKSWTCSTVSVMTETYYFHFFFFFSSFFMKYMVIFWLINENCQSKTDCVFKPLHCHLQIFTTASNQANNSHKLLSNVARYTPTRHFWSNLPQLPNISKQWRLVSILPLNLQLNYTKQTKLRIKLSENIDLVLKYTPKM